MKTLETDYLVVGAGAAGLAFTDALVAACDADVIVVDRREAPGGHWNDAYPFVRLHQPSSYYGVNSMPLGGDALQQEGPNQGFYEQASGPEIVAYFGRVMRDRLLPSGRVRHWPSCDYTGGGRFVSRRDGETFDVRVRRKLVDATYLEPSVPATTQPPFELGKGARCAPVGALPDALREADCFTIVGAGKTAMDACVWLMQSGVPATDIRWIKPRDGWLVNRASVQALDQVGTLFEGVSLQLEAAARAESVDDLFERLVAAAQWLPADEGVRPAMYKAPIVSAAELEMLRGIRDVVRLGRLRRVDEGQVMLQAGTVPARKGELFVHCATIGLNRAQAVPIFSDERITLQPIRTGLIPFNAAMVGFVEATRTDTAAKNRLCPPNRLPDAPLDWLRGTIIGTGADYLWSKEPDIAAWLDAARLNPTRGVRQKAADPQVRAATRRYVENAGPAVARLRQLLQAA